MRLDQRGLGKLLALRRHDVADIDQPVVPGKQRDNFGRGADEHVRDDAGLHRRDDLLAQRRKRHDIELERVTARLRIIRGDLLDRDVLFLDKPLRPPQFRGLGLRIGNVRPG
jgi:hypothetical protein